MKISDEGLAYEYGLDNLPQLVYYRKKVPIVYSGEYSWAHYFSFMNCKLVYIVRFVVN